MSDETYEYQSVNVTQEPRSDSAHPPTIQSAANRWAQMGWRTVGVMPARGPGYADCILVERLKLKETNAG